MNSLKHQLLAQSLTQSDVQLVFVEWLTSTPLISLAMDHGHPDLTYSHCKAVSGLTYREGMFAKQPAPIPNKERWFSAGERLLYLAPGPLTLWPSFCPWRAMLFFSPDFCICYSCCLELYPSFTSRFCLCVTCWRNIPWPSWLRQISPAIHSPSTKHLSSLALSMLWSQYWAIIWCIHFSSSSSIKARIVSALSHHCMPST